MLILGKSIFKKGFGSAPGLLVGCSIGCCFATWLALFFTAAQMQSGYLLTARARAAADVLLPCGCADASGRRNAAQKELLNDSDSQLFQACYGLGFFTGIVYVRAVPHVLRVALGSHGSLPSAQLFFAAAMFWLRSVMIGGALAAQEEALALREQELKERERSGRRGFFGRGRTEAEPTPEPPAPAPSRITNPMAGLMGRGSAAPAPSAAPAFASAAPAPMAAAPAPAPAPAAAPAAFSNSNPWA